MKALLSTLRSTTPFALVSALLALYLMVFVSLPVQAQTVNQLPGYVDFGSLNDEYGEPRVMINIGGFLLKFMAAAAREDPKASALMQGLEGVRINVYAVGDNPEPALEQVSAMKSVLQAQAWQPIVQVREPNEQVQIFVKAEGEQMQGLTVMTVGDEEAVFINIIGSIDPENLSAVMDQLNVDVDLE